MKINPTFKREQHNVAHGYSSFPMDNLLNMTSCAGYLIPVYWDFLDPGDKVKLRTLLRTKTQPLTSPAMATCIERIEWFAVPIDQLYKPFSAKFYGINDVSTDLLPISGYNDYLPYADLTELNTWVNGLPLTFQQQSAVPSQTPIFSEVKRFFDAMGMPFNIGHYADKSWPASINVLPFAAYQKIYSDHYRLTDREENDPLCYNLDSFMGTSTQSAQVTLSSNRFSKLFQLRKRPYGRDYFTSMQVSPLFGSQDVNASGNDLTKLNQWLTGLSGVDTAVPYNQTALDKGGGVGESNSNPTTVAPSVTSSASSMGQGAARSMLSPANIRSLFAVEKLLEVTRNAKKHYDMQTLAHFGVDVPKGLSGECFKIGTHEQYLQIGEVISTASTDSGTLGELAGRGSSDGSSPVFDFEAKCHCVLMAVYSMEPVVNYANDGIDRLLSMTNASDFYKSEFDNLGLQPVFFKELRATSYNAETVADNNYNNVIGWQSRYQQLKGKYNRSTAGINSQYFSEWALNRTPLLPSSTALSRNFFYVWPTDLDNIMLVPYSGTTLNASTMYSTDPLINQIYFDVQKASKKSIHGTPNF